MGKKSNYQLTVDTNYIRSGQWKCPNAPINPNIPLQVENGCGAHHWVERWFGSKVGYAFLCKYCYDVRKFRTTWGQVSGGVNDQITTT